MKRIIGLCLAFALAFGLVACGGQNDSKNENADAGNSVNSTTENQSQPSEQPEADKEQEETPPAASGETTPSVNEQEEQGEEPGEEQQEEGGETPVITASHSDVTFKSAGSSFKLTPSEMPETVQSVTYTSKDESVATVAGDGTVTAVAPGVTDVVMTMIFADGSATEFTCIVRCNWQEASEGDEEETPVEGAEGIDLAAFFVSYMEHLMETLGEENTPSTMAVEGELLDAYYAGLNAVAMKQCLVQMPGIGAVPFEFALVEVENAGDVDTVRGILQARVTYQVEGGAWYPATIEGWEKAEIIVNGNYVALIVAGEQQADAVAAFNALFN